MSNESDDLSKSSDLNTSTENCSNCRHSEIFEMATVMAQGDGETPHAPKSYHLVCNYPHDPVEVPDFDLAAWCSHWEAAAEVLRTEEEQA